MNQMLPTALFEQQVLQALAYYNDQPLDSTAISSVGIHVHGDSWAGKRHTRKRFDPITNVEGQYALQVSVQFIYTYPRINLALGRLAQKGLVERMPWSHLQKGGYSAGRWYLTDLGKMVMGIE